MLQSASGEIIEAVPFGIGIHDPSSGELLDVNQEFCDAFDRPRSTVLGARLEEFLTSAGTNLTSVFNGAVETGEDRSVTGVVGLDGEEERVVDITLSTADVDGVERVVSTVRVVPESRARGEERRYQRLLDGAMLAGNVAWWEMDVETGAVEFHESKTRMLGYDADGFTHYSDFTDLVHSDDYEPAMEAMRAHLEGRAVNYDTEYRIQSADGEYRWFRDIGGITRRTDDGAPKTVTGVVVDITERKEAAEQVRTRNDELRLLTRMLRHDVRNDAAVILAWVDDLREARSVDADAIDRIEGAGEHIVRITESAGELLDLLREWEASVDPTPTDVNDIVEREVTQARSAFEHAEIAFDSSTDATALADATLGSVVRNLVNNAVLHNDSESPRVAVSVEVDGDDVRIRVADDGPGIPDAQKHRLFERGEKGEESSGTGIGLYLVERLTVAYGGDVWVEDNDPTGAVFVVALRNASVPPANEVE